MMFLNAIIFAALAAFLWFGLKAAWSSNKFLKWLIVLLALPIVVFIALVFSQVAFAQPADEDLENCVWRRTGEQMSKKTCDEFRAEVAADEAQKQRQELMHEEFKRDQAARAAAEEQEHKAVLENNKKVEAEKNARQAAEKREIDAYNRKARANQKASAAREQIVKGRCGADYKNPKIGMTIARAQDCVAKFRLTSELNRADGVISTYEAGNMYLHVMDGYIVSWGKY